MFDEPEPPSLSGALVALAPLDPEWHPILHVSNQVVLYNATSHALSIRTAPASSLARHQSSHRCPYCNRSLPTNLGAAQDVDEGSLHGEYDEDQIYWHPRSQASNYFQLLEIANETASRPQTPSSTRTSRSARTIPANGEASAGPNAFRADNLAEGYFKAFFREEGRLGMGANGTVYLCQHVLDGNTLGHFAVKKIAVGQSHSYLLNILREVRLLERLHHPNIVTYHHAWLETCRFSAFGPQVPTLHVEKNDVCQPENPAYSVLMQWAEGGSLDDFIDARLGRRAPSHLPHMDSGTAHASQAVPDSPSASPSPGPASDTPSSAYSRSARIRAFRALQRAPPEERERLRREAGLDAGVGRRGARPQDLKAIHLLSAEEVKGLFGDVVAGLAFLHDKSILHLDLKPGNVLLTWDEGRLIPRAMLSDFGTSQDMLKSRTRSGNTGTLEYSSPESLPSPSGALFQVDSKADMWSVGMILHKLLFFRLPYSHASDSVLHGDGSGANGMGRRDEKDVADALEREVQTYAGFKSSGALVTAFESRRLPRAYLVLLESLLNVNPAARPSSERVLSAIREGRLNPLVPEQTDRPGSVGSLIPVPLRRVFDATALFRGTPSPSPSPDLHARVSQELDPSMSSSPMPGSPFTDEKKARDSSVGPQGSRSLPFAPSTNGVWARTVHIGGRQVHVRIPRVVWLRTLKSCVLVVKVLSLSRICLEEAYPHPVVVAAVLGLAVMDTWFDALPPMLVLTVLHVVIMKLACWGGRCCGSAQHMDRLLVPT